MRQVIPASRRRRTPTETKKTKAKTSVTVRFWLAAIRRTIVATAAMCHQVTVRLTTMTACRRTRRRHLLAAAVRGPAAAEAVRRQVAFRDAVTIA